MGHGVQRSQIGAQQRDLLGLRHQAPQVLRGLLEGRHRIELADQNDGLGLADFATGGDELIDVLSVEPGDVDRHDDDGVLTLDPLSGLYNCLEGLGGGHGDVTGRREHRVGAAGPLKVQAFVQGGEQQVLRQQERLLRGRRVCHVGGAVDQQDPLVAGATQLARTSIRIGTGHHYAAQAT